MKRHVYFNAASCSQAPRVDPHVGTPVPLSSHAETGTFEPCPPPGVRTPPSGQPEPALTSRAKSRAAADISAFVAVVPELNIERDVVFRPSDGMQRAP